uniref:glycosyltransferase family 4 protein n=1 Tax=uncultured Sphingomonas sp. TaxID=158754 RepID=UPI0035CA9281
MARTAKARSAAQPEDRVAPDRSATPPHAANTAAVAAARPGPHLAFVLQGLGAGGSEHVVSQLCNHFASLGWTITVLAFEHPAARPYYAHDPAVRIIPLGMKAQRRGPLGAVMAVRTRLRLLRNALEILRPDIVVSFLTRTNVLAIVAARALHIPIIVSERNNPELQTVGPVWNLLRRWTYPRAAGLVTMTHGAMRFLTEKAPLRGWVIPNPATIPSTAGAVVRQSDGRTIGAVGRLVPQKGFDLLVDAFARVAPAIPDWHLVIWGEGLEREALVAQIARLEMGERVSLPGVTAHPGEWIGRSDIFVLSSRFEGWGLVVGEAMAAGLPVIAFDCPWGPGEMIEDGRTGVLVPNGDVDALGETIVALCRDAPLRDALGARAIDSMRSFAPETVLAQWQKVVTDVLES